MKNEIIHEWESFSSGVERFSVPGGWLYREPGGHLAFVPKPQEENAININDVLVKRLINAAVKQVEKYPFGIDQDLIAVLRELQKRIS